MENCIFCKIVKKSIPAHIVFEDDKVMVILDISQTTKGHSLLLFKNHSDNLTLTSDSDLEHGLKIVKRVVSKQLQQLSNIKGVNIINNVLAGAGQSVMHTHIHMVPRYHDDSFKISWVNHKEEYSADDLKRIQQLLML
jgi:histidine triad (HIT) family protein